MSKNLPSYKKDNTKNQKKDDEKEKQRFQKIDKDDKTRDKDFENDYRNNPELFRGKGFINAKGLIRQTEYNRINDENEAKQLKLQQIEEKRKEARKNDTKSKAIQAQNNYNKNIGGSLSVVAVHFPPDTTYNTSIKRLNFIRKLGLEPIKRQHKTPSGIMKYRIKMYDDTKTHFTKKINGVNLIFEK
jgi:hypothetical protein